MGNLFCSCGDYTDEIRYQPFASEKLRSWRVFHQDSRVETSELSDEEHQILEKEAQQQRNKMLQLYRSPMSVGTVAAAFASASSGRQDAMKMKLREPILSPKSKFNMYLNRLNYEEQPVDENQETPVHTPSSGLEENQVEEIHSIHHEEFISTNNATTSNIPRISARGLSQLHDDATSSHDGHISDEEETEERWKGKSYIRIVIPPGSSGILIQTNEKTKEDTYPIVSGFTRLPNGMRGTVERSQLIDTGCLLLSINGVNMSGLPIARVRHILQHPSKVERLITFQDPRRLYHSK